MGSHLSTNDVTNDAPGYDGSATFSCNDGNWEYQSGNCVEQGPADCDGERLSWGGGCSAFASSTEHGESAFLSSGSSSSSRVGSAEFVCNDGAFELQPGSNCDNNSVCQTSDPTLLRLCAIYRDFYDRVPDSGGINYYTNEPSFVNGTATCQQVLVAHGTQNDKIESASDCARFVQNKGYKPIEAKDHECTEFYYNGTRFHSFPGYRSPVGNQINNEPFCSQ